MDSAVYCFIGLGIVFLSLIVNATSSRGFKIQRVLMLLICAPIIIMLQLHNMGFNVGDFFGNIDPKTGAILTMLSGILMAASIFANFFGFTPGVDDVYEVEEDEAAA